MNHARVLHLVEYLYLGGIERLLEQLCTHTDQKQTQLVFLSYETNELAGIGLEISRKGHKVYTTKKKSGRDWGLVSYIQQIIQKEKINTIHTHDFGPMEYALMTKFLSPKIKLVHTQHTLHHFITNKKYTFFFQFSSYFYHSLICVSEHVKKTINESCPFTKRSALKVIYNGVDTEKYKPTQTDETTDDKLRLVSISRLSQEKNFEYLLNTCLILKNRNISFTLHHAGTSDDKSTIEEIREFIKKNSLCNSVILHGYVEQTQNILSLGEYFISASHTEGHPVAVLEAMSAEKICLISDIAPHREICQQSLVFFNKENPHELADILSQLTFEKKQNLNNNKRSSREVVLRDFSIHKMVNEYETLYR